MCLMRQARIRSCDDVGSADRVAIGRFAALTLLPRRLSAEGLQTHRYTVSSASYGPGQTNVPMRMRAVLLVEQS